MYNRKQKGGRQHRLAVCVSAADRVMTIKELRAKTGMSQHQFAEYINIPKRTIQSWEQMYRQPPAYVVSLIERILKNENMIDTDETDN